MFLVLPLYEWCGTINWGMGSLSGVTDLEKFDFAVSSNHQFPIDLQHYNPFPHLGCNFVWLDLVQALCMPSISLCVYVCNGAVISNIIVLHTSPNSGSYNLPFPYTSIRCYVDAIFKVEHSIVSYFLYSGSLCVPIFIINYCKRLSHMRVEQCAGLWV